MADGGYCKVARAEVLEAQVILPHVPNRAIDNHGDGLLFGRRRFAYEGVTEPVR